MVPRKSFERKITTTTNELHVSKNGTFERHAKSSRNPVFGWWNEKRGWFSNVEHEGERKYGEVCTYVHTYCTREANRGATALYRGRPATVFCLRGFCSGRRVTTIRYQPLVSLVSQVRERALLLPFNLLREFPDSPIRLLAYHPLLLEVTPTNFNKVDLFHGGARVFRRSFHAFDGLKGAFITRCAILCV